MNRPVILLLVAIFFCAPLAAEQALFRNAMIGYGGGTVIDMKTADVNHDGNPDVILLQAFDAFGTRMPPRSSRFLATAMVPFARR